MSGHDPDLPILEELGAEFARLVEAEAGRTGARRRSVDAETGRPRARRRTPPMPSRAVRERRAQVRRVGRRTAIVAVLVCLVGGVALAALHGGGSAPPAHTEPTPLGRAADGAWTFSVYRDGGRLCEVFVPNGGEPSGRCGVDPGRGRVAAQSGFVDGHRYLFGLAGPDVMKVKTTGARSESAPVLPPVDRGAATDAGLPAGDRWFVIDLGPKRGRAPAIVTPYTRRGGRSGPPYVDCSLGVVGEICARRIEAAAASR